MSLKEDFDNQVDLRKFDSYENSKDIIEARHKKSRKDIFLDGTQSEAPYMVYGKVLSDIEEGYYRHKFKMEFQDKEEALDHLGSITEKFTELYTEPEKGPTQNQKQKNERKVLDMIGSGEATVEELEELDVERETVEDTVNRLLSDGTLIEHRPGKFRKL